MSGRAAPSFAYAAGMADDSWRNARVRHAEEALAAAVRTADEIIAEAYRAVAGPSTDEEPVAPPAEDAERPILRDAW